MKPVVMALRLAFLALFIYLLRAQALMVWLILYLVSLLVPLLVGKRVYCMAACPINTVMMGVIWLRGKLGIVPKPAPRWARGGTWAWVGLAATVVLFFVSRKAMNKTLPVMLVWLVVAIFVTLRYHPDTFHDGLCPYGALQRELAKVSLLSPENGQKARDYKGFSMSVLGAGGPGKKPMGQPPQG